MNQKDVECLDCWSEALMSVGIYSLTYRIPKNLISKAKQSYEDSFHQSHNLGNLPVVS